MKMIIHPSYDDSSYFTFDDSSYFTVDDVFSSEVAFLVAQFIMFFAEFLQFSSIAIQTIFELYAFLFLNEKLEEMFFLVVLDVTSADAKVLDEAMCSQNDIFSYLRRYFQISEETYISEISRLQLSTEMSIDYQEQQHYQAHIRLLQQR